MKDNYAKTPTVYQMEAAECGAASLAMILGYFGKNVPLEQLRVETGVSRDGCNAGNILRAARKYGLETKGYRKSLEGLLTLQPPCIIHWNFNHFVVFEGKKRDKYYINDPAYGRRGLTIRELDEAFTGVVLTFEKTESFVSSDRKGTFLPFIKNRLKGNYKDIGILLLIGFLLVFPGICIPAFEQMFIDEILIKGNTGWIHAFLAALILAGIFRSALYFYREILLQKLQNRMAMRSAYSFLYHMFRLPVNFFSQRYAGDLAERVENNNNVSDFLAGELAETVLNIVTAFFYFILLFIYSPMLTLIGVAGIGINFFVMKMSSALLESAVMKQQQDQGKMTGAVLAGLNITESLKAAGAENEYVARILGHHAVNIRTEQKLGRIQQMVDVIPQAVDAVMYVLVLLIGGMLVIRGDMSAGMLAAFGSLLGALTAPVNSLMEFVQRIQTLKADIRRVEDIENYEPDEKFRTVQDKVPMQSKLKGKVEMQGVSFGYSRLAKPLVEDIAFSVNYGSSIAFTGASGSGKSTVTKLVSGLYQPWEGEIRIDGIPMQKIPAEILSASVSTVSQEITLFSGTIKDNLTMWNQSIREEDMIQAAKDACIHDVITKKPGAYEFRLNEGGTNFSGGQRQRLEIARALVTNPTVLILDEATSALDPVTEKEILDNIKRRGCTCIIVAHRLSAIRDCDEIIVMAHGEIAERGSHEKLVSQSGYYRQLIQNE